MYLFIMINKYNNMDIYKPLEGEHIVTFQKLSKFTQQKKGP